MTSNFCGRVTTRANVRGHGLLDQLQHLKNEMQQMERRLAKIEDQDLKARVRNLEIIFSGMAKLEGSAATGQGSVAAHEGDALGDAVLFSKDPSLSPRTYCELYGLTYEQVLNFYDHTSTDDGGLYGVLNAHATALAQGRNISKELRSAFRRFLYQLEEHWFQLPDKDPNSPLGMAYFDFWRIRGREQGI